MLLKRETGNEEQGTGKEHGEWEIEKWEQNRELEMKLLTGRGFKLGFVPIFSFSLSSCSFPAPRSPSRRCFADVTN